MHDVGMTPPPAPVDHVRSLEVSGVEGVPLAVKVRPAPGRVPAVLVHGFGSSARGNWAATGWVRTLRRAGVPTVTVDLRGHGESGKPHEMDRYSIPILMADLRRVLAALPSVLGPMPEVDLVGYSMGARLVAELVRADRADPAGSARSAARTGRNEVPKLRRAVLGGYDGRPLFSWLQLPEFTAALAGRPGPAGSGRRIADIALADPANDLAALSALVYGLSTDPTSMPAGALTLPILVVAGERDDITDRALEWASGMPRGESLVVPGRDHITVLTAGLFRTATTEFLTR